MKKRRYIVISSIIILIIAAVVFALNNRRQEDEIIAAYQPLSQEDIVYEEGDLFVDSQILITAETDTAYSDIEKIAEKYDGKIVGYISISNDYQIEFPEGTTYSQLSEIIENEKTSEGIEQISLNYVYETDASTINYEEDPWIPDSDPDDDSGAEWSELQPEGANWWAEAVCLPSVWDLTIWDKPSNYTAVNIGIIDSYFDTTNKELEGVFDKVWFNPEDEDGKCSVPELYNSADKEEKNDLLHGTHVAGIIAAKAENGFGITGTASPISPKLYGYAEKGEAQAKADGPCHMSILSWKYAIALMLQEDVKVINISLGFDSMLYAASQGNEKALTDLKHFSDSMEQYLKKCIVQGYDFMIVKSAGNTAGYAWKKCEPAQDSPYGYKQTSGKSEPCDVKFDVLGAITDKSVKEHIIIVGATERSWKSLFGNVQYNIADFSNQGADVYAPGKKILSAIPDNGIEYENGTSMATPIVSGTAALMWSVNSDLSAGQIKDILVTSTKYGYTGQENEGVSNINAYYSVVAAKNAKENGDKQIKEEGCIVGAVYTVQKSEEEESDYFILKNVPISIYDQEENLVSELKTDKMGTFEEFLPEGVYILKIQTEGYTSYETEIELDSQSVEYLQIQLEKTYDWSVEPVIEADDIFYLKNTDAETYSYNELHKQFMSKYAVVKKNNKYGLVDMEGNFLAEPEYGEIRLQVNSYYVNGGSAAGSYYVKENGDIIPGTEPALGAGIVQEPTGFYYSNGLHYMLEEEEHLTTPVNTPTVPIPVKQAERVVSFSGNNSQLWAWWDDLKGSYGIYNRDKLISEFTYDECGSYSEGLLAVCKNGKWGYVDENGEYIISPTYDPSWTEYTPEDTFEISTEDMKTDYCYSASDGYIVLVKDDYWELRNVEGDIVIPSGTFEKICPVYEGKCWVKSDGKWGVIELNEPIKISGVNLEETIVGSWVQDSERIEYLPAAIVFGTDNTVTFGGNDAEFYNAPYYFENDIVHIHILEADEEVSFRISYEKDAENEKITLELTEADSDYIFDLIKSSVEGTYIKHTTEITTEDYQAIYGPILQKVCEEYSPNNIYYCYDIDKDGVKELIVQEGFDYSTYMFKIYTIKDEGSVYLGEFSGFHCELYRDESGGTEPYIIRSQGLNQNSVVSHISIEDGRVVEKIISNTTNEGYYSNPYNITYANVDVSLLLEAEWYER